MIFWHMGVAAVIVYVTLGRSRIDYRWILIGAVVPDMIDGILSTLVYSGDSGRGAAHSLLAPALVALVILLTTRGTVRLSLMGLAVGWVLHLVGDGMWAAPKTFLWPAFGTEFADTPVEPYSRDLFTHPFDHLATWGGELLGLAALVYLAAAFELGNGTRRKRFFRDGLLRA